MSTWKLLIEDDAGKTIVVPLTRDVITIGRKEGNTIRLTERNVSRFHAKLVRNAGEVFIEDLGSYNGIKLNGDRIKGKVEIQEGDLIEIGDYHLALQAEGQQVGLPDDPTVDSTARMGPGPGPGAEQADYDDGEDDEFAGDTQRWEPPASMEPVPVGLSTMQDQAPLDSRPVADAATMDETVPIPSQGPPPPAQPAPASQPPPGADLDATIRNPSAPNPAAPNDPTMTEPYAPAPSGSDEASGDLLPPPGGEDGPQLPSLGMAADQTAPLTAPPGLQPASSNEATPPPGEGNHHPGGPASSLPSLEPVSPAAESEPPAPPAPAMRPAATPSTPAAPLPARPDVEETAAIARDAGEESLHQPRLVALNTVFAGSVFPLRDEEIVIGRVEDNDLVIEHRSVSRSHAKLVKDGAGYRIVDLKSANGVLLNGEEIGQAQLKGADVIELGRVRLRYVPPGEQFSLAPDEIERARLADAQGEEFGEDSGTMLTASLANQQGAASPPTKGNPNTILLAAALAIIVLLLVVIVILLFRDGGGGSAEVPSDPRVVASAEASDEELEAIEREKEGSFHEALAVWQSLQSENNPRAEAAIARLEQKIKESSWLNDLQTAHDNGQWDDVVELGARIPEDSIFADKAKPLMDAAQKARVDQAAGRVERNIESGKLGGAKSALQTLERYAPDDPRTAELGKALAAAEREAREADRRPAKTNKRAERRRGRGKRRASRDDDPKRDEPAPRKREPEPQVDKAAAKEAADAAQRALVLTGDYDAAKRHALQAKKLDPSNPAAYRVLGQVYANKGDSKRAVYYYRKYLKLGGVEITIVTDYLQKHGG